MGNESVELCSINGGIKRKPILTTIVILSDIDAPIQTSKAAGQSASEPPEAVVANMMDMGFSRARAIKALKETVM